MQINEEERKWWYIALQPCLMTDMPERQRKEREHSGDLFKPSLRLSDRQCHLAKKKSSESERAATKATIIFQDKLGEKIVTDLFLFYQGV